MRWRTLLPSCFRSPAFFSSPTCFGLSLLSSLLFSLVADVPPSSAQELQLRPEHLDLGISKPGGVLTSSFSIHNGGTDEQTVLLSVEDSSPFAVTPDTLRILPGADRQVTVRFSARQTGQYEGQISYELKKLFGSRKLSFAVAARVERPRLDLDPPVGELLELGVLDIGDARQVAVVLSNSSAVELAVDGIHLEAGTGPFSLSAVDLERLAPGERISVKIAFSPVKGGSFDDALVIVSPDLDPPRVRLPLRGTGLAPTLAVSPLPEVGLDFEHIEVGEARILPVIVVNRGISDLRLKSIQTEGEAFAFTGADTALISPGQRHSVPIRFEAAVGGAATGALRFSSNDPKSATVEIPLRGRAVISPALVEILNDDTIDFGSVAIGKSNLDHLVLWNRGGSAFTVELEWAAEPSGDFDLEATSVLLQPGKSSKVGLHFSPKEVGYRTATLVVATPAGESRYQLVGTGKFLQLSPATKSFDRVPVGESTTSILELENTGNSDFTVTRISSTSDDFTPIALVSLDDEFLLPADSRRSLPVSITFAPSARGLRSAALHVEGFWEEGAETLDVLLSGTGVFAEIELHPTGPLDFGWVVLGKTEVRTLVATNSGDAPLQVEASPLGREARVEPAAFSLAQGESTRLQVYFSPESLGDRFSQILLVSNDLRDKAHPIKVKGRGALEFVDLARIASISTARNASPTPLRVDWNNQPIVLTDGTRIDLSFDLPDSLRPALVGRKILVEWVQLDEDYEPKGGTQQVEVQVYDDDRGSVTVDDLHLRMLEASTARVRLRVTTHSYPGAPPQSISQIFEAGGWKWEFEAKPLLSFLTIRPSREYTDKNGKKVKGETERLIALPGIAFFGCHDSRNPSVSGIHFTAIGNVLEALSTNGSIAVSLGLSVSLYKDRFLLGFGWDVFDSRPRARRKGTQDYIMTIKYSGMLF